MTTNAIATENKYFLLPVYRSKGSLDPVEFYRQYVVTAPDLTTASCLLRKFVLDNFGFDEMPDIFFADMDVMLSICHGNTSEYVDNYVKWMETKQGDKPKHGRYNLHPSVTIEMLRILRDEGILDDDFDYDPDNGVYSDRDDENTFYFDADNYATLCDIVEINEQEYSLLSKVTDLIKVN